MRGPRGALRGRWGGANRHVPQRQRRARPLAEAVANQRARLFCLGGRIKSPGGTVAERSGRGTGGERGTARGHRGLLGVCMGEGERGARGRVGDIGAFTRGSARRRRESGWRGERGWGAGWRGGRGCCGALWGCCGALGGAAELLGDVGCCGGDVGGWAVVGDPGVPLPAGTASCGSCRREDSGAGEGAVRG